MPVPAVFRVLRAISLGRLPMNDKVWRRDLAGPGLVAPISGPKTANIGKKSLVAKTLVQRGLTRPITRKSSKILGPLQKLLASSDSLCYHSPMLTLLQNTKTREGNKSPWFSGRILGNEAGCLPMPISCSQNEMHASEVFGYSSVLASIVEQNTEECFAKNISRKCLTTEKK